MIRLDDTACAPYLNDGGEIDGPLVFSAGVREQVEALNEGHEECCKGGGLEIVDERFLILLGRKWDCLNWEFLS